MGAGPRNLVLDVLDRVGFLGGLSLLGGCFWLGFLYKLGDLLFWSFVFTFEIPFALFWC